VAEELPLNWPVEDIPDEDYLYMWVNSKLLIPLQAAPSEIPGEIFREHEGAMSTCWDKYATPSDALQWAKNPAENGIITLNVGDIRRIPPLEVVYAPDLIRRIQAHTNVYGVETKGKKSEIRVKLSRIASWKIAFEFDKKY